MPTSEAGTTVSFKNFQLLNPTVSLYQPSNPSEAGNSPACLSPSLIIFTPWLSAQPKHITKYTDAYQSLFPAASILVICTTAADMVYRPYTSQQEELKTILPLLKVYDGQSEPDILLHMFSNAGVHKASQLARAYRAQNYTALKCGVMVFDSSPGVATYSRTIDAMTVGLPAIPVLRQVLVVVVHLVVGLIWLQSYFSSGANLVKRARKDLNDSTLVEPKRGRLYMYSTDDRMVGWEDVEAHALEAERNGERVKREKWSGTPHVGHMANDGEKYWGAIRSIWDKVQ